MNRNHIPNWIRLAMYNSTIFKIVLQSSDCCQCLCLMILISLQHPFETYLHFPFTVLF